MGKNKSTEQLTKPARAGVGFADDDFGNNGNHNGSNEDSNSLPSYTAQIGLWALLATITMLFAGFTSAYILRRNAPDWTPFTVPSVMYFNTGLLILSSITLEIGRSRTKRGDVQDGRGWLSITALLGIGFLISQFMAWKQLRLEGIYLSTNPHSSFFYVLTGVHGLHVLGGIFALLFVVSQAWRNRLLPPNHEGIKLCATYWHFVDGLWIYLFLILFMW